MRIGKDRPFATGRVIAALTVASASVAVGACGNVTMGGFSELTVDVSGDGQATAPALQRSVQVVNPVLATGPLAVDENDPEGEIEIDIRLALVPESGSVLQLGNDDIRVKIDLRGVNEAEALSELVPSGRYTELRISFTHIQVEVARGLVIDGTPVVGEVHIALEDPTLLVSRPIDLVAPDGGAAALLVDLNAPSWLEAVDPVTQTVDASVFAGLVDVVVR